MNSCSARFEQHSGIVGTSQRFSNWSFQHWAADHYYLRMTATTTTAAIGELIDAAMVASFSRLAEH